MNSYSSDAMLLATKRLFLKILQYISSSLYSFNYEVKNLCFEVYCDGKETLCVGHFPSVTKSGARRSLVIRYVLECSIDL